MMQPQPPPAKGTSSVPPRLFRGDPPSPRGGSVVSATTAGSPRDHRRGASHPPPSRHTPPSDAHEALARSQETIDELRQQLEAAHQAAAAATAELVQTKAQLGTAWRRLVAADSTVGTTRGFWTRESFLGQIFDFNVSSLLELLETEEQVGQELGRLVDLTAFREGDPVMLAATPARAAQDLPVDTRRVALAINYAMHLALKKGVQAVQDHRASVTKALIPGTSGSAPQGAPDSPAAARKLVESSPAFNEIMRSVCEAHFGRNVFDFDEGAAAVMATLRDTYMVALLGGQRPLVMQLMSPVVEAGPHAGAQNALYWALLRVVRRCMELAAWTEVANADVVLCVPAVTKDTTAHLGVSATASIFTKREHTDVSEFMVPSSTSSSGSSSAAAAAAAPPPPSPRTVGAQGGGSARLSAGGTRYARLVEGSSRVYPVGLVLRDRGSLESPYLEHGVWARAEDWQVWHHGRDLGPAARAKLMGIPVEAPLLAAAPPAAQ